MKKSILLFNRFLFLLAAVMLLAVSGLFVVRTHAAGELSLTAKIYSDEALKKKVIDLVPAGSGETAHITSWDYTASRYLQIAAANIPDGKTYELVVSMKPVIKAMAIPETGFQEGKSIYQPNIMHVNKNETYTVENYSGTIVWELKQGTKDLAFPIQLAFNVNLWNKTKSVLNADTSTPLLYVALREKDTQKIVAQCDLTQVTSASVYKETAYPYLDRKTVQSINQYKDDPTSYGFNRMVSGSYSGIHYYPKVQYTIGVPKYEDKNKNVYYLKYDTSKIILRSGMNNDELNWEIEEHQDKIIITLKNFFTTSNLHLNQLYFSLPDEVQGLTGKLPFKGTLAVHIFATEDAEKPLDEKGINVSNAANFTINYFMEKKPEPAVGTTPSTITEDFAGTVQLLGGMKVQNLGFEPTTPYRANFLFDANNSKAVRVTTVRLPMDRIQPTVEITYSMVDENGVEQVTDATYSLENTCRGVATTSMASGVMIRRDMLPEEHRNYYFKSIQYEIREIPADTALFNTSASKRHTSGGTFWGYVVGKDDDKAEHVFTMIPTDESLAKFTKKATTTVTTVAAGTSSYELLSLNATGGVQNKDITEINAGDDFTISGIFRVSYYTYGNVLAMRNPRIGLLLPKGVSIDENNVRAETINEESPAKVLYTYENIKVIPPTDDSPLWIVEFLDNITLGYATENLDILEHGRAIKFSVNLHTDEMTQSQTQYLYQTVWGAAKGQMNQLTGSQKTYLAVDTYDLNENDSTTDNIAQDNNQKRGFTIKGKPAMLEISSSVRGSDSNTASDKAALEHFADHVIYDLDIACTDGGTSKDFYYLVPIPKLDSVKDDDFVVASEGINLELHGAPQLNKVGSDTVFKLWFTKTPADELKYDVAAAAQESGYWFSEEATADWTEADWKEVTAIKITGEGDVKTGTRVVLSIPLYYGGDNYEYAADATNFMQNAGMTIRFSSRGHYSHATDVQALTGTFSTDPVSIRLEYTLPEVQYITLTAAKGNPQNGGTKTMTISIPGSFKNPQKYTVRKVDGDNVVIVDNPSEAIFKTVDNNSHFAIAAQIAIGDVKQTKINLSGSASVAKPQNLGNVSKETAFTVTFTLTNGNDLSDTTTPRSVAVDIIGDMGVTIPVVITINREASAAEAGNSGILAEKRYLPFDTTSTSVTITKGSAYTAQFVSTLVPKNYKARTLTFTATPPNGTTVLMIDWTDDTPNDSNPALPRYYYTVLNGATTTLPLTSFVGLGGTTDYCESQGTTSVKEVLQFIVDFPDDVEAVDAMIRYTKTGPQNVDEAVEFTYLVEGEYLFDLSPDTQTVSPGGQFTLDYSVSIPTESADTRYGTREMALVITGATLPADAYLVANSAMYTMNNQNQFIVPIGAINNGNVKMTLHAATMTAAADLDVKLYVSATSDDERPMEGERVASASIKVQPGVKPALKLVGRNSRILYVGDSTLQCAVAHETLNLSSDMKVYIQVQKKVNTAYVTGLTYLSSVNGTLASRAKIDVTSSRELNLRFNALAEGTYRVLFTVEDSSEEVILSQPYNILVVPR